MSTFVLDSPLGLLLVETSLNSVSRLDLVSRELSLTAASHVGVQGASNSLMTDSGGCPRSAAEKEIAADVEAQLAEYFTGERHSFELPLDFEQGSEFQRCVWGAIADIPYGEVASYADIAMMAGRPGAARAAGSACGANPVAILTPCHRVVGAGGKLGGYGLGLETKVWLLRHEGVYCSGPQRDSIVRGGRSVLGV